MPKRPGVKRFDVIYFLVLSLFSKKKDISNFCNEHMQTTGKKTYLKGANTINAQDSKGKNIIEQRGGGRDEEKRNQGDSALAFSAIRKQFFSANGIENPHKKSAHEGLILSILLHGCETWSLAKQQRRRLHPFP